MAPLQLRRQRFRAAGRTAGFRRPAVSGAAAGRFTLQSAGLPLSPAAHGGRALPDDVSMVLHTSGTTSRPKIVPLSQRNLAASATHIRNTLQFTAWVPLVNATRENGCMEVVRGSHRLGLLTPHGSTVPPELEMVQ